MHRIANEVERAAAAQHRGEQRAVGPPRDRRLELAEQAVIEGDVYYNLIEMSVGAKVNGGMRHSSNVADDLAAKREAKAAESTVSG